MPTSMRGKQNGALLGLAGPVVEVDLLVRAAAHALPPAAAAVLVDEHDAVLGPLVDGAGRAGRGTDGFRQCSQIAGQVEHERLLELELHLVGDVLEHHVLVAVVRASHRGRRPSSADHEIFMSLPEINDFGAGDRRVLLQRSSRERLVVVGPGLVVVVDRRQLGVGEDRQQLAEPAAALERSRPRG
jgi:hypothetical protein